MLKKVCCPFCCLLAVKATVRQIVALRLLFSYNVDRALYNADPWSQECGLAEGMVDAVRLGTMQVRSAARLGSGLL